MPYRFLLIAFFLFILSCKQSSSHVEQSSVLNETDTHVVRTDTASFEIGKVIDPVSNNINASQSFALYLPKNYSSSFKYPVIYFFDAHASGRMPLDKYFSLADEFNFILVGSNDSKNGMQTETLLNIVSNIMQDVKKRFPINTSRQYVAGFSGGARVAGMAAMQTSGIAGVIACSASINANSQNNLPFCFVGIAGKEDFNMNELVALNKQLDQGSTRHQLLLFNGKHEWCPLLTMKDGILFLETAAMRNKTALFNNTMLNNFKSAEEKHAKQFQTANHLSEAATAYQKLIHYLDQLQDIKSYQQAYNSIQQNKSYQAERTKEDQLLAEENQLRQNYMSAFGREILWWKNEVGKINNEIRTQGTNDRAFMLKRVLGSLSLASYMQANSLLNTNELDKADYILQIYCLVDPTNSEAWYISAELHAKQGNTSACLKELQAAIKNNFKERDRMMNDPAFASIANSSEFISLLNKIKI